MTSPTSLRDRRSSPAVRVGLWLLAIGQGIPALWALAAPRSWFDTFPGGGHHWVSALPPYNQHLTIDYGAGYLALAVLAVLAALLMERRVVQAAMAAWLVAAVPHFVYHLTTLGVYSLADQVENAVTLGLAVVVPGAIMAWATASGGPAAHPSSGPGQRPRATPADVRR